MPNEQIKKASYYSFQLLEDGSSEVVENHFGTCGDLTFHIENENVTVIRNGKVVIKTAVIKRTNEFICINEDGNKTKSEKLYYFD